MNGYPTIKELRSCLKAEQQYIRRSFDRAELTEPGEDQDSAGTDVRIRVYEGEWSFYSGDNQYDQDHRGNWGCGFLPYSRTNLTELAREMIQDAKSSDF